MNIVLDFLPFMYDGRTRGIGGVASFAKSFYNEIIRQKDTTTRLFALYDSSFSVGKQYDYQQYARENNIRLLDISSTPISTHIEQQHINVLFIAVGQFYASYDLNGITCKTIMFIHDIADVERADNRVDLLLWDKTADKGVRWLKQCANIFLGRWNRQNHHIYSHITPLYAAKNTFAFTVSEYSRSTLKYYFPKLKKDIQICYSPAKSPIMDDSIENETLRHLIDSGKPYLLMLAANRPYKNIYTVSKVFKRLATEYPDLHLLTLKYGHVINGHHIDIPFLSDSDLEHAYKHALALIFGSFFEGFGYPPLEAMRHGTPTIASNVTSIPEILGDAGIYFSPFYPADLYRAIKQLIENPHCCQSKMEKRLAEITLRQKQDMQNVIDLLFER